VATFFPTHKVLKIKDYQLRIERCSDSWVALSSHCEACIFNSISKQLIYDNLNLNHTFQRTQGRFSSVEWTAKQLIYSIIYNIYHTHNVSLRNTFSINRSGNQKISVSPYECDCFDNSLTVWQVAEQAGLTWMNPLGRGTMRPSSSCRCWIPVRSAPSRWPLKPWQCLVSLRTRLVMSFKCELWDRQQCQVLIDMTCVMYLQWYVKVGLIFQGQSWGEATI